MNERLFTLITIMLGAAFALAFVWIVIPPLIASGDAISAFAAGFVNPYSTGYSLDAIFCGLILTVWVLFERRPYGWIAIPLCLIPGVATAFAVYLLIRLNTPNPEDRSWPS
ncbi:MAG: DUF2834 domain-containing protein [Pseudomonadota bacterium]